MASHMNPKKQRVKWDSATFSWDNCTDDGPGDIAKRSRMCAEAVMAGLQVSSNSYTFHYACDKGFAGLFCSLRLFHFRRLCLCCCFVVILIRVHTCSVIVICYGYLVVSVCSFVFVCVH